MRIDGNYHQSKTAFKMNLRCEEPALTVLRNGVKKHYANFSAEALKKSLGDNQVDFDKIYKNFKQNFEKETSTVEGTVNIIKSDKDPSLLKLSYTDKAGKTLISDRTFVPYEILPKQNANGPYSKSVMRILAVVSNLIADSGVGYGKQNKAYELFVPLFKQFLK